MLAEEKVVPISGQSVRQPNPLLEKLKSDKTIQAGMTIERDRQAVALKLRAMRKSANLTQKELADTLETTQKQISRMESCAHTSGSVTLEMISRFATACKMALVLDFEPVPSKVIGIESPK